MTWPRAIVNQQCAGVACALRPFGSGCRVEHQAKRFFKLALKLIAGVLGLCLFVE